MLTDAHCHPFDLLSVFPNAEQERRRLEVLTSANACSPEEFSHNEALSHNAVRDETVPLLPCFGIHPQIFKYWNERGKACGEQKVSGENLLETLDRLAGERRIAAIGECGFDLYDAGFRETEKLQEQYFTAQIEIALKYDLPLVLHARRAMHKIFAHAKTLSKCKSVVFHSWPGTFEEALSFLKRGVNAYFSFGNTIMLNHKQAIRSCALLPAQRLLTETDAPYQPGRGKGFSQWEDLPLILETAAGLRREADEEITMKELEAQIEKNFCSAFTYKIQPRITLTNTNNEQKSLQVFNVRSCCE